MTDLPPGWELARLDAIAEVRLGRQRSPKNHVGSHMRPYLRAANVGWNGLKLDDVKEMNFTDDEAAIYRLLPGDLVLSEASGSPGEVGKPALWEGQIEDCCFQNTLIRIRSHDINPTYLLHFFRHQALSGAFAENARGVGIHHLGSARLSSWLVPIPPLQEQERIVASLEDHLSRLDAAKADVSDAAKKIAPLLRSIYSHATSGGIAHGKGSSAVAIGEQRRKIWRSFNPDKKYREPALIAEKLPPPHPPTWTVTSLEAATDPVRTIRYGILMPRIKDGSPEEVPYIEVRDLAENSVSGQHLNKTSRQLDEQFANSRVSAGDVVLAVRGSYDRSAVIPSYIERANLSRDVVRLAPLPEINPHFLHFYLQGSYVQSYLKRHARGVAVKGVNVATIRQLPVAFPPRKVQDAIALKVYEYSDGVTRLRRQIDAATRAAAALRGSILSAAFNGQLVPQDTGDEPASKLLASIQAKRAAQPKPQRVRRTKATSTSQPTANAVQEELL